MPNEQLQPVDSDQPDFWAELARRIQVGAALRESTTEPLSPEQEYLLWGYAEGELPDAEEKRCLELLDANHIAAQRLLEIQGALDAAEAEPAGRPAVAWARATAAPASSNQSYLRHVQDLIIELASGGLNLIYSAGQPAYAPSLARSSDEALPTSIGHEFLTSIGTIQLIVDQATATSCDLTVFTTRLLNPDFEDSIFVDIEMTSGGEKRTERLAERKARFHGLAAGAYELLLREGTRDLDRLRLDIKAGTDGDD